jgi:PAS domain S-box-containing protein
MKRRKTKSANAIRQPAADRPALKNASLKNLPGWPGPGSASRRSVALEPKPKTSAAAAKLRRRAKARLRKQAEDDAAEQLRFEALLVDLSSKFVNVLPGEVDREIVEAQRRICEFLGLDISALWQWSDEARSTLKFTHIYRVQEGPSTSALTVASDNFPWCQQELLAGRIVNVSSLAKLPAAAARDLETWRHFGVKTSLTFPLSVGGAPLIGALSFNTVRAERTWPEPLIKRLQLVAQIFTNALARKRADQAVRESEERMTLAAEAAGVGVWVWNIPGNEVWGSERWLDLFGFAPDTAVTFEKVIQRIHPDDRKMVEDGVRRSLADRSDYMADFRVVSPDGIQRWIVSRGRMYQDSHGKPARMLGTAIDITERKRNEAALRASEARLSAGTELAGLGYYEVDFGEHACFIDERFQDISGVPAGLHPDLQSLEFWMDHLHPDDRQQVMDERQKLHEGKLERLSVEYRYLHPAQGQKWIHHVARVAARSATGRTVRSFGVIRDITESKQSEAALRASEELNRVTFEQAAIGVAHIGTDGRWLRVNDKLCAIVGYPREELLKLTFQDITHPEDLETELNFVRQILSGEIKTHSMEKRYVRKDRSSVWVVLTVSLVRTAAGAPLHFIAVVEDITGRKQAEAELTQHRAELAHVSRVSTMGALTASLAHELNQPLSAILSNAQAALRFLTMPAPDTGEVQGALEDIAQDTRRASEVIRQMRALVRKDEPRMQSLDINQVISEVVRMLHSDTIIRKVRVTLELDPDLRPVSGDSVQLQQVMLNLVLNAFDAMRDIPEDMRMVTIRTRRPETAMVRVEVSDGGTGLSPEMLLRLFEPFSSSKREGLGLGLSISHSIIEAHKGRIWAENNPAGGATFYFTLPLHEPELKPD